MKQKVTLGIVFVVIVILAIFLTQKDKENTLKIGYFGPLTGLLANSTGESVVEGFKLAESQRHTVGDKTVQVIYEDDSCDPKKAVSAAQKLIDIDKVDILVSGVCSGSTLAVAPIAEQHKVILISPTSASPKITTAGDYVFRLSSPTTGMAQKVVEYINKLGYTNVALLYENNEYPAGWKDSFLTAFKGTVNIEVVAPGVTDVKTQLTKLQTYKPQVFVFTMISPATANAALKQIKELGIKTPVIGNDTFSIKGVSQQKDAEGIHTQTYSYDISSPVMTSLLSAYKEKFGRDAKEEIYTALGYDTYNALFDSITACASTNPECIKKQLYNLKSVQGVSGTYSIDANGDTQRSFTIRRVEGGKLVEVK